MSQNTDFTVRLKGDESGYSASLKKARQTTNEFSNGLKGSGGLSGGLSSASTMFSTTTAAAAGFTAAMAGAVGTMLAGLQVFDSQQQRQLQLQQQLRITGYEAGFTAEQLKAQADQLALSTLGSVDGIMEAQGVLITMGKISGETFTRATALAQDLAAVMGGSAKDKAMQLGKALSSPVTELGALGEAGIRFTEAEKQNIKVLAESGRLMEAQALIIEKLESKIGGAGGAQAGGLAGSIDTISQRWDEFKIALVTSTDANSMAEKLLNTLANGLNRVSNAINPSDESELNALVQRRMQLMQEMQQLGKGERTGIMSWLVGTRSEQMNVEREYNETTARIREIQNKRKAEQIKEGEAQAAAEEKMRQNAAQMEADAAAKKKEQADKEAAAQAEKDAATLRALQKTFADRRTLESINYQERENDLEALHQRGAINEQQWLDLSIQNYQAYQTRLTEIQKQEEENRRKEKSNSEQLAHLQLMQAIGMETAAVEIAHLQRMEALREALNEQTITKQQFNDIQAANEALFQAESAQASIGSLAAVNGHFLNALEATGKKRSLLYKAMFAAQQAAAIPSIIVDTEKAAVSSLAMFPGPAGVTMSNIIRGMGYASAGVVAGQAIAGAFENGGIVPGSSYTGDNLLAAVNSREMILNESQQRRLFDMANGKASETASGPSAVVQVINAASNTTAETRESTDDQGRTITQVIIRDLDTDGEVTQRMMNKFRLNPYGS